VHNPRSGIVLVNGCGDRAGAISPVSCVVANLAHGLRRQGTPVLVFFCGLHTGDELRGPGGLLRCLVAQLVVVLLDKGWMEEGECVGGRMEDLGGLFGRLMELVPEGRGVWCLVDGAGYVEGGEWQRDWERVVEVLGRVVREGGRSWFKLLITSAGLSRGLGNIEHQRVNLRGGQMG